VRESPLAPLSAPQVKLGAEGVWNWLCGGKGVGVGPKVTGRDMAKGTAHGFPADSGP
jgi:hypothetical protein